MTDQEPTCLQFTLFIFSAVVAVVVPAFWLWLGDPQGVLRIVLLVLLTLGAGGLLLTLGGGGLTVIFDLGWRIVWFGACVAWFVWLICLMLLLGIMLLSFLRQG